MSLEWPPASRCLDLARRTKTNKCVKIVIADNCRKRPTKLWACAWNLLFRLDHDYRISMSQSVIFGG